MKGIVLAGGTGSRLYPVTKAVNKHLLPVGNYPMIFHPLAKMQQSGIDEVLIVTNPDHIGSFVRLLGSGWRYGMELTFKIQDQPGGIAQALSLGENFAGSDGCLVILGDNIFTADLSPAVRRFRQQPSGAKVFLKKVADPQRYGIAMLQGDQVASIEEKPLHPVSDFCVTGIYLYDSRVFELIRTLRPSGRNELEITDVNNAYLREHRLSYEILEDWWTDAGTFDSLQLANEYARNTRLPDRWQL